MTEAHGFVERYDPWTGRAWLDVQGPEPTRIAIDERYAEVRSDLRGRFPDRPFTSEWAAGRFPGAPYGLPLYPVLLGAWVAATAACVAGAAAGGPLGAAACALAAAWPLVRLLDGVGIHERGLRIGPAWAPLVPWHDVLAVGLDLGSRGARVWARTRAGAGSAWVPPALVPAVRARVRRLGGLALEEGSGGLDQRYAGWRAAATGAPWGLLLGVATAAWVTPWPWGVLGAGLVGVAGLALLGAAIEARATGWGTGASCGSRCCTRWR